MDWKTLLEEAEGNQSRGEFHEAVRRYKEVLKLKNVTCLKKAKIHTKVCECYYFLNELEKGLEHAILVINHDESCVEGHIWRLKIQSLLNKEVKERRDSLFTIYRNFHKEEGVKICSSTMIATFDKYAIEIIIEEDRRMKLEIQKECESSLSIPRNMINEKLLVVDQGGKGHFTSLKELSSFFFENQVIHLGHRYKYVDGNRIILCEGSYKATGLMIFHKVEFMGHPLHDKRKIIIMNEEGGKGPGTNPDPKYDHYYDHQILQVINTEENNRRRQNVKFSNLTLMYKKNKGNISTTRSITKIMDMTGPDLTVEFDNCEFIAEKSDVFSRSVLRSSTESTSKLHFNNCRFTNCFRTFLASLKEVVFEKCIFETVVPNNDIKNAQRGCIIIKDVNHFEFRSCQFKNTSPKAHIHVQSLCEVGIISNCVLGGITVFIQLPQQNSPCRISISDTTILESFSEKLKIEGTINSMSKIEGVLPAIYGEGKVLELSVKKCSILSKIGIFPPSRFSITESEIRGSYYGVSFQNTPPIQRMSRLMNNKFVGCETDVVLGNLNKDFLSDLSSGRVKGNIRVGRREQSTRILKTMLLRADQRSMARINKRSRVEKRKENKASFRQSEDPYESVQLRNSCISCGYCGRLEDYNKKLKNCGGCKKIRYCNLECQKSHWSIHKKVCRKK